MRYVSTRNTAKTYDFKDVFIKGLADDGGLFIPSSLPKYSEKEIQELKSLNYSDLAKKIINKEIPAEIIYEDDVSIVIEDINPQAPTHLLIIPKKVIPKLSDASNEDQEILGHLMLVAGKIADQLGLDETFRLVVNNGAKAGQSVFHLHLHLISGRPLNWPPG